MELYFGLDIEKDYPVEETFYVGIEAIEPLQNGDFQLTLDGINSDEFKSYAGISVFQSQEKVKPSLFYIQVKPTFIITLTESLSRGLRSLKWLAMTISSEETALRATQFTEAALDDGEERSRNILGLTMKIPQTDLDNLRETFNWNGITRVGVRRLKELLNATNRRTAVHRLNLYHVGQGNLSAVVDHENVPFFYFDLGGGFGFNRHTYPNHLDLCFTKTRTIILSHWDLDHLETARRLLVNNPSRLKRTTWIAPKQNVTPFFFRLAAKLMAAGAKLYLWDSSTIRVPSIDFWAGRLIKCNGSGKNHSGLALLVQSPNNDIKYVLHPADAAYVYIPSLDDVQLDGLVATHHGAEFDVNNAPIPSTVNGAIAFAYGANNSYGHAILNARTAHDSVGWVNSADTVNGNISFTKKSTFTGDVGCNGLDCSLTVTQHF